MNHYDEQNIYRFKSDNSSTQYKCLNIFPFWRMAMTTGKPFIIYYGVSGHGKGLVDGTSSFGMKHPLRKAIITEVLFLNTSKDM